MYQNGLMEKNRLRLKNPIRAVFLPESIRAKKLLRFVQELGNNVETFDELSSAGFAHGSDRRFLVMKARVITVSGVTWTSFASSYTVVVWGLEGWDRYRLGPPSGGGSGICTSA